MQFAIQNEVNIVNLENDINKKCFKSEYEDSFESSLSINSSWDEHIHPCELYAISFRKLIFKVWAKNTFWQGFIPFVTWFVTCEENINLRSCSNELYDKLWETYLHSLNYRVHLGFIPSVCEGHMFEDAACKIAKINLHPQFKESAASICLIGLSFKSKDKIEYCYSPFGRNISYDTYGIYIINNKKTSQWVKDKSEIDKLLREWEIILHIDNENNNSYKNYYTRIMKRNNRIFPDETEKTNLKQRYISTENCFRDEWKSIASSIECDDNSDLIHNSHKNEWSRNNKIKNNEDFIDNNNSIYKIFPWLEQHMKNRYNYKVTLSSCIIDPDTNIEDHIENHIIVCGFKDGLEYYINAIRNISEVPIVIIATSEWENKMK